MESLNISLSDVDVLARTVWGEARGESYEGKCAVAHVILNRWRAAKGRKTIEAVCQEPWQFSCWNAHDPNRAKLLAVTLDDPMFRACWRAALDAFDAPDATKGARHYCTIDIDPAWAHGHEPIVIIGRHQFFVGIN